MTTTEQELIGVVEDVVRASGVTGLAVDVAVEVVSDSVLEWPSWYYEYDEQVRPPLQYKDISAAIDGYGGGIGGRDLAVRVEGIVRSYVGEYASEIGKPVTSELIQTVMERILFYKSWYLGFIENAYWDGEAEDLVAYYDAYAGPYGESS